MPIDAKKVLVGAPDQSKTTGAVSVAGIGAKLPEDARAALEGFTACGYVSEDGVVLTPDYSTKDIPDWSGASVRSILESFKGEVTLSFIQTGYEELCAIFGKDHVTKKPAGVSNGEQVSVKIGAHLAPPQTFAFNMKDGDARMRMVVPNGQVIPDGDISFQSSDPVSWGARIICNADESGESIYIYTDDGVVSA